MDRPRQESMIMIHRCAKVYTISIFVFYVLQSIRIWDMEEVDLNSHNDSNHNIRIPNIFIEQKIQYNTVWISFFVILMRWCWSCRKRSIPFSFCIFCTIKMFENGILWLLLLWLIRIWLRKKCLLPYRVTHMETNLQSGCLYAFSSILSLNVCFGSHWTCNVFDRSLGELSFTFA